MYDEKKEKKAKCHSFSSESCLIVASKNHPLLELSLLCEFSVCLFFLTVLNRYKHSCAIQLSFIAIFYN